MLPQLFSIRMRATLGGAHISGAERIAPQAALEALSAELTARALEHPRGVPDEIQIRVEALAPASIVRGRLPDLTTVRVAEVVSGREAALAELVRAGVAAEVASAAIAQLAAGAHPDGGSMRGAMLIDALSGQRLERDQRRGVRASRMDLSTAAEAKLRAQLQVRGLDNAHVREALVLAGKVLLLPGFVAELCWSDDPDYSAGYVCSRARGYVRFPYLKPLGDNHGGRAFFVCSTGFDNHAACDFLQRTPVLFEELGNVLPDERWPA